jgi:hypothetical protein
MCCCCCRYEHLEWLLEQCYPIFHFHLHPYDKSNGFGGMDTDEFNVLLLLLLQVRAPGVAAGAVLPHHTAAPVT